MENKLQSYTSYRSTRKKINLSFYFQMHPISIRTSLFFLLIFIFSIKTIAQPPPSAIKDARLLKASLNKNHIAGKSFDDDFSLHTFRKFIYLLDPYSLYFTKEDIKEFAAFNTKLDNELSAATWQFIPLVTKRYKERLTTAETTIEDILSRPINYTTAETLDLTSVDSLQIKNYVESLSVRWKKWLTYACLNHFFHLQTDITTQNLAKTLITKETEIRNKVKQIEKRKIKKLREQPEGVDSYVVSQFFNAITSYFDPHSTYMTQAQWESYKGELSDQSYSYGFDLDNNETGDIIIIRLNPGGPAWKSNELNKGDRLVELKWPDKNPIDLTAADADEANELLKHSTADRVEIKVEKPGGQFKTVTLVKQIIRDDENIVKSFILQGEQKIGYISLPGFYSEWENYSGLGCANDVAKEIIKLKEEKITGLILDIRSNGGGSIVEGLNLAGIFINEGPLFIIKDKSGKLEVMKDQNRGTIYDGPLVVMVNGTSASASEILASTLQDYNRALIVGSRTFGKATGQIILPLDTTLKPNNEAYKGSMAAITVDKLYRVTGKSAQIKGVTPDIVFPDIYENLDYKESSYLFVLPSDSVTKKVYFTPLKPLSTKELKFLSNGRVEQNKTFQAIAKVKISVDKLNARRSEISLNAINFHNYTQEAIQIWKAAAEFEKTKTSMFTIGNNKYENQVLKVDNYHTELNNLVKDNLQKDIYLEETYKIISDLIQLNKN